MDKSKSTAGLGQLPSGTAALLRGDRISSQFVRFLLVGILNTAVSFLAFALLILAGLGNMLALLIATVVGILFNFQTIGRFVFRRRDGRLLGKFFLLYSIIYAVNAAALHLLTALGMPAIPAQAVLLPLIVFLSFVLNRTLFQHGSLAAVRRATSSTEGPEA